MTLPQNCSFYLSSRILCRLVIDRMAKDEVAESNDDYKIRPSALIEGHTSGGEVNYFNLG